MTDPLVTCISWGSQLSEEQHEHNLLENVGFLNLQGYYEETICTDLFCTGFLHGFVRGFFSAIFCADCARGFYAKIFVRVFCTDFLGCPTPLGGKRQNFTEKIPSRFTMLGLPSGEGEVEGEVETLA